MIIRSRKIWAAGQFFPACIEISKSRIRRILPYQTEAVDIDFADRRIVPGFLDIHTHGAYGYDTNDGTEEGLRYWMEHIVQEGVTSILPTTVTQMPESAAQGSCQCCLCDRTGIPGGTDPGHPF